MSVRRTLVFLLLGGLLSACQPSYFAEQSDVFLRSSTLSNNYTISRSNHLVLPRHSRLFVVSNETATLSAEKVTNSFSEQLSQYFAQSYPSKTPREFNTAKSAVSAKSYDYLLHVAIIGVSQDEEEAEEFEQLQIRISVVEVSSKKVIDIVKVQSKEGLWVGRDTSFEGLMNDAFHVVAKQLAGQ